MSAISNHDRSVFQLPMDQLLYRATTRSQNKQQTQQVSASGCPSVYSNAESSSRCPTFRGNTCGDSNTSRRFPLHPGNSFHSNSVNQSVFSTNSARPRDWLPALHPAQFYRHVVNHDYSSYPPPPMDFIQSTPMSNHHHHHHLQSQHHPSSFYSNGFNLPNMSGIRGPPSVTSTTTASILDQFVNRFQNYLYRMDMNNDVRSKVMQGIRQCANDISMVSESDNASVFSCNTQDSTWSRSRNPPSIRNLFHRPKDHGFRSQMHLVHKPRQVTSTQEKTVVNDENDENVTSTTTAMTANDERIESDTEVDNQDQVSSSPATVVRNPRPRRKQQQPPSTPKRSLLIKNSCLSDLAKATKGTIAKLTKKPTLAEVSIDETPLRRKQKSKALVQRKIPVASDKQNAVPKKTKKLPVSSKKKQETKGDKDAVSTEEQEDDDDSWFVKPLTKKKLGAQSRRKSQPDPAPSLSAVVVQTRSGRTIKPPTDFWIAPKEKKVPKEVPQPKQMPTRRGRKKTTEKEESFSSESKGPTKTTKQAVRKSPRLEKKKTRPAAAAPKKRGQKRASPVVASEPDVTPIKMCRSDQNNSFFDVADDILLPEIAPSVKASAKAKRAKGLKNLSTAQTPPVQMLTTHMNSALFHSGRTKAHRIIASAATPDWEPSQRTQADDKNYQEMVKKAKKKNDKKNKLTAVATKKTQQQTKPKKASRRSLDAYLNLAVKNKKYFHHNIDDSPRLSDTDEDDL